MLQITTHHNMDIWDEHKCDYKQNHHIQWFRVAVDISMHDKATSHTVLKQK